MATSIPNRPAGSGRSRQDTHKDVDDVIDESLAATRRFFEARFQPRKHYCAKCRSVQPTTIIRGYNGARDHNRCESCGRTWPR